MDRTLSAVVWIFIFIGLLCTANLWMCCYNIHNIKTIDERITAIENKQHDSILVVQPDVINMSFTIKPLK